MMNTIEITRIAHTYHSYAKMESSVWQYILKAVRGEDFERAWSLALGSAYRLGKQGVEIAKTANRRTSIGIEYYESGQIKTKSYFKNGKRHGNALHFTKSGGFTKCSYKRGLLHGPGWSVLWGGDLRIDCMWNNGKEVGYHEISQPKLVKAMFWGYWGHKFATPKHF